MGVANDAKGSALAGCMGGAMLLAIGPPKSRSLLDWFKSTSISVFVIK
jgi:hypothetical protein